MVTFPQAVKAATIGVAYQMHRDADVGSIKKGKLADLIIIDRDLRRLLDVSPALRDGDPRARSEHMKQVVDANVAATNTKPRAAAQSTLTNIAKSQTDGIKMMRFSSVFRCTRFARSNSGCPVIAGA